MNDLALDWLMAQCTKITKNVSFELLMSAFFTNFCPIKLTHLVTLFDHKLQVFKKLTKIDIF